MPHRIFLRLVALVSFLLLTLVSAMAQDVDRLKAGVVRITNTRSGEGGAGFIVKIDKDKELIYIVTASHVVKGNGNPAVYLFNDQFEPLSPQAIYRESESQKGLALLVLKPTNAKTFSGLTEFHFGASSQIGGGEFVRIIGFPGGKPFWDVTTGTISHIEGNNLAFAGSIRGGNSGGPVILSNGQVIGLVTDTIEPQDTSYAAKAEIIVSYVNGNVSDLIKIEPPPVGPPQTITLNISLDEIEVYEHGGGATTRWDFEVFANTTPFPLGQKIFKKGKFPISKSFDVEVVADEPLTIKVVGDRHKKGVQASGEVRLLRNPNRSETVSQEITVKVPKDIADGNFKFHFTIKRKLPAGLGEIEQPVGPRPAPQTITLNVSLDKIVVYEHGGGASTRWSFEVMADTASIPLAQQPFKKREYPINKSVDIEIPPNREFTIKVVGDKHEAGVQAKGEITFRWDPSSPGDLSKEIQVKVPGRITKGNFTFYFTIKRKITGTSRL